jgi:hypothetical protein
MYDLSKSKLTAYIFDEKYQLAVDSYVLEGEGSRKMMMATHEEGVFVLSFRVSIILSIFIRVHHWTVPASVLS